MTFINLMDVKTSLGEVTEVTEDTKDEITGYVDLVIKNNNTDDNISTHKSNIRMSRPWRTIFSLFIICSVDMIIFCYMINIHYQATNKVNTTSSTTCIYELEYLCNTLYVIIPGFCLLSTLFLAIAAKIFYLQTSTKKRVIPIVLYFTAIVVHSVLFWYENILISNIISHTTLCININTNVMVISYALIFKGIVLNILFILSFIYYIYLCYNLNRRKCIIVAVFSLGFVGLISIFFVVDVLYIHVMGALFGLLHINCHLCSNLNNHHHLATTYVGNYSSEWACCPGGFCCEHGCTGCCEWNCKGGGFCVVCYAGCCSNDIPDSLCFSCCGICSCFCADAGGCYGAICCSYDFFTFCGCGCC